jgi:preprotein translocase subunit SecE
VKAQRGFESLPLRQPSLERSESKAAAPKHEARRRAEINFCSSFGSASQKKIVNSWTEILVIAVIVAAVFGYLWWQGQVRRFADYCRETYVELWKCSWPNWQELKGSTALIGICIGLLGAFVSVLDILFSHISHIFYKL